MIYLVYNNLLGFPNLTSHRMQLSFIPQTRGYKRERRKFHARGKWREEERGIIRIRRVYNICLRIRRVYNKATVVVKQIYLFIAKGCDFLHLKEI